MESVMIKENKENIFGLFDDFTNEKEELESTLATIELLADKDAIQDINKGIKEIENKDFKSFSFDEIDDI